MKITNRPASSAQSLAIAPVLALLLQGLAIGSEESEPGAQPLQSTQSPVGRIQSDDAVREAAPRWQAVESYLDGYVEWKKRLKSRYGLSFGFDYAALYLAATESPGESSSAGGIARAYGNWELVARGTPNAGSWSLKLEHRHRIGADLAPQQLGFELGYEGFVSTQFSDRGWLLTNFYWHQQLLSGRMSLLCGIVDSTDYVNVYGLFNPYTDFNNSAFATDNTIPAPSQGLGAAASFLITPQLYVIAGLADANGDPSDPADAFDSFFDSAEYFAHLELGWIGSLERRFDDNIHVTLWHADSRAAAGTASGWGVALSWSRRLENGIEPFVRAGIARDGGALWEASIGAGLGYAVSDTQLLGIGLNWSRPSEDTLGPGLNDQFTSEVFYRIQILGALAVTPSFQLLVNPASNPDEESIGVFGLRLRLVF